MKLGDSAVEERAEALGIQRPQNSQDQRRNSRGVEGKRRAYEAEAREIKQWKSEATENLHNVTFRRSPNFIEHFPFPDGMQVPSLC